MWGENGRERRSGQIRDMITEAYLSPFKNIFENLALEDFFLREDQREFILFYINDPCVVMGNFQNPWAETNSDYLRQSRTLLARRQSGGGCVYHDLGNLNFCVFKNKSILTETDKSNHLKLIQDLLTTKGIKTEKLEKSGMVFLRDNKRYKFSGEAFKQINMRSFHHGTLLINSDLEHLITALKPDLIKLKTKAVASNPHLVGNLEDVWSGVTPNKFYKEFLNFHNLSQLETPDGLEELISKRINKWSCPEQIFGKTPLFEVRQNGKNLAVSGGRVIAEDGIEVRKRDFSGELS